MHWRHPAAIFEVKRWRNNRNTHRLANVQPPFDLKARAPYWNDVMFIRSMGKCPLRSVRDWKPNPNTSVWWVSNWGPQMCKAGKENTEVTLSTKCHFPACDGENDSAVYSHLDVDTQIYIKHMLLKSKPSFYTIDRKPLYHSHLEQYNM